MREHDLQAHPPQTLGLAGSAQDSALQEGDDYQPPMFDEQFGIRLGGRSYYINLRIGTEMRTRRRRAAEGQVRVSGVAFLYCVICSGAIMLFGTLCLLYLLKSGMGLNIWDEDSVLHPFFELMMGD
ncbi:MAG: hypothetical protein ACI89J_002982 [Hyphomicrobiaceae bacterium]|jgi:hypothetical protein